jgi:hypothetical protein
MHRSHALFGYKRPGLILLAIPSVPAADIATAFLRGLICSGVSRRVFSVLWALFSRSDAITGAFKAPPPGLFIHPPQHLVPGGQHGREPRGPRLLQAHPCENTRLPAAVHIVQRVSLVPRRHKSQITLPEMGSIRQWPGSFSS